MLLLALWWNLVRQPVPDFAALPRDGTRQQAFVDHLCPMVNRLNAEIRAQRERLVAFEPADDELPTQSQLLLDTAAEYGLSTDVPETLLHERVLSRVDEIPPPLVIAQAALESGWGTSTIAVEANNLFGRRCFYVDDCYEFEGAEGKVTRYRKFADFEEALRLYFRDLNVLQPYRAVRAVRTARGLDAWAMAQGLSAYSSRGSRYVQHVRKMIAANDLQSACASDTQSLPAG